MGGQASEAAERSEKARFPRERLLEPKGSLGKCWDSLDFPHLLLDLRGPVSHTAPLSQVARSTAAAPSSL